MARKYYAQIDALGFPIPGTLMSVGASDPIPVGCIEIPAEDRLTSPENVHPEQIRYYVRHDGKGAIIPNSLIMSIKRPEGLVYEFQPEGHGHSYVPPTPPTPPTPNGGVAIVRGSSNLDLVGDFTIEFFMNLQEANAFPRVFSVGAYPTAKYAVSIEGGGSTFYFWANGSIVANFNLSPSMDLRQWHHIAIVRSGNTVKIYKGGQEKATGTLNGDVLTNGTAMLIGAEGTDDATLFNGFLSNFRISDSPVYTSDFGMNVPNGDLTASATTKLLCLQGQTLTALLTDNSGKNNTITNNGQAYYSSARPFMMSGSSIELGKLYNFYLVDEYLSDCSGVGTADWVIKSLANVTLTTGKYYKAGMNPNPYVIKGTAPRPAGDINMVPQVINTTSYNTCADATA